MQDTDAAANPSSLNARLLVYDITGLSARLVGKYVVPLNRVAPSQTSNIARQSEIHYISDTQFLVLGRDSGRGHGQGAVNTRSRYRDIDIFDSSAATNITGKSDFDGAPIAPGGILLPNITAAQYARFVDFNINAQLHRFQYISTCPAMHNSGAEVAGLVEREAVNDEYYLLSLSDNDIIAQDGQLKGGQFSYADRSGYNLNKQALVFKVKIPSGSNPLVG